MSLLNTEIYTEKRPPERRAFPHVDWLDLTPFEYSQTSVERAWMIVPGGIDVYTSVPILDTYEVTYEVPPQSEFSLRIGRLDPGCYRVQICSEEQIYFDRTLVDELFVGDVITDFVLERDDLFPGQ